VLVTAEHNARGRDVKPPSMQPSPAQIYVFGKARRISFAKGRISSPDEQRLWKYKKAESTN
jgi:hypothetical protein